MIFTLVDGMTVEGDTYTEVVRAMNNTKMTPAKQLSTYRRATAMRIKDAYGVEVDWSSDEAFVLGMERADLLKRQP
jgi:hypothetical protein